MKPHNKPHDINASLLGVGIPFTLDSLKKAYRRKAIELHPDQSGYDSEGDFRKLQEAYEHLLKCPQFFIDASEIINMTQDSTPLSKLGLGLGPNINGAICGQCNGDGFTTVIGRKSVICDVCNDAGLMLMTCPQCKGSKGFTSILGHHVTCLRCNDVGRVVIPHPKSHRNKRDWYFQDPRWCTVCGGTKIRYTEDKESKSYRRCGSCMGTGETRIYNPVIPKGRIL
jgi:DnaJ-class molecular chaperone